MKLRPQLFSLLVATSSIWMVACDDSGQASGAGGDRGSLADEEPAATYNGPTCEAEGDAYCTGSASGVVCAEGSTNGVEFRCASGEECVDGACEGICEAGATECAGSAVQRLCAPDGHSWLSIACGDGRSCVDGECLLPGGLACTPGERKCDSADVALVCNDEGSGWDEEDCPNNTACEDGACMGSVCAVGASKCSDAMLQPPPLPLISGNLDTIFRCVDGSTWVAELCPSDEESRSVCVFDGVAPSEADAYQEHVNDYFENAGAVPNPPTMPSFTTASCVEVPEFCGEMGSPEFRAWVAPKADRTTCGDYSDLENIPEASWSAVTSCVGMPPFSALSVEVTRCSGLTACLEGDSPMQPASCQAVECLPTEAECADGTSYSVCDYESFAWDGTIACDAAAACANSSTTDGQRSVTCGGVAVDPWNPPS